MTRNATLHLRSLPASDDGNDAMCGQRGRTTGDVNHPDMCKRCETLYRITYGVDAYDA